MSGWVAQVPCAEARWLASIKLTDASGSPLPGEITADGCRVILDEWAARCLAIPCRSDVQVTWDGALGVLRIGADAYTLTPLR